MAALLQRHAKLRRGSAGAHWLASVGSQRFGRPRAFRARRYGGAVAVGFHQLLVLGDAFGFRRDDRVANRVVSAAQIRERWTGRNRLGFREAPRIERNAFFATESAQLGVIARGFRQSRGELIVKLAEAPEDLSRILASARHFRDADAGRVRRRTVAGDDVARNGAGLKLPLRECLRTTAVTEGGDASLMIDHGEDPSAIDRLIAALRARGIRVRRREEDGRDGRKAGDKGKTHGSGPEEGAASMTS